VRGSRDRRRSGTALALAAWVALVLAALVLQPPPTAAADTPDLAIVADDIAFSRVDPVASESFLAYALVRNLGNAAGTGTARFSVGATVLADPTITVAPGGSAVASAPLSLPAGLHNLTVTLLGVSGDGITTNDANTTTVRVFASRGTVSITSPTLLLNGTKATIQGGTTRSIPIDVTVLGGDALGISLRVFDSAGTSADPATPPFDAPEGETVRVYLRITAPDVPSANGPVERRLLIQAVAANARGNVGAVLLSIHPPVSGQWWTPTTLTAAILGALGVLLAAVNAVDLGRYKFLGILLPLYARLNREGVLDQYTRGKIHGYLLANPGEYFTAIGRALGISSGNLAYHLRVLLREGHVTSRKDGLKRRFFPRGVNVEAVVELSPMQRAILNAIRETPGIRQKDIAGLLKVTSSAVSYHLQKLAAAGVVEARRRGMSVQYFVAPKAEGTSGPSSAPSARPME